MVTVLDFAPGHWSSGVRLTALAIADRVNSDGVCWPSVADISRRTGLTERQVQRNLRQLEAEGIIERTGKRYNQAGIPRSNLWTWRLWVSAVGVTPTSPKG